jgi:hypothetical protein
MRRLHGASVPPVSRVGPLPQHDGALRLPQPPERAAEPVEGLRALVHGERPLERLAGAAPITASERLVARREIPLRRDRAHRLEC